MKTSLSIWSVHRYVQNGSMDNIGFIDFVGKTGAQGVELLSVFWNDQKDDAQQVREALARNGLELACFGACNNLAVTDPAERREQIADVTGSVDKAAQLGAKVVRVFSGDKAADVTYEQAKAWIIEGLKEGAAYAQQRGITLCLENHGYFAGKADQVLEVIDEVNSPALRSTFDTGNFLLVDDQPNEAMDKLLGVVSHVHFKDFLPVGEDYAGRKYKSLGGVLYAGKVPGEGIVDLKHLLGKLKRSGYQGWLTVEYEGDDEQKEGSVRSIDNLKAILAKL
ncbi:sugar phosphate isomerase/epimerase family protein [Paenibacillus ehimensis]|uniref:Sugar phosphate isomerase/epimerase family protein n=1 Tax=Paenibacillus ehimensis TaxID=79264 RepID=A0ABT8VET4_9BACL|nr:sugar phosphate isomerase/epimerase family protein [Paenibacillus ehimensis]MDO3679487.1 sugar phosphate isomerase/epimerase family protein [Paenibacillus ehimensis]MEC0207486.1 sugar phosphate isomerase/epimerase [Paenibacillus ehimensis]